MRAPLLALLLLLGSCAMSGEEFGPAAESDNPAALRDAYVIAHGMAISYATSGRASSAVVAQLARLDARAAQAVVSMQRMPSDSDQEQASAAVSAFAAFAARQAVGTP